MIEDYRVSLGIAKRLKEAGFPQEDCDAYWVKVSATNKHTLEHNDDLDWDEIYQYDIMEGYVFAAPCVGRLGDELPDHLPSWRDDYRYVCSYSSDPMSPCTIVIEREKEADARALMWIKLKQKGLL